MFESITSLHVREQYANRGLCVIIHRHRLTIIVDLDCHKVIETTEPLEIIEQPMTISG